MNFTFRVISLIPDKLLKSSWKQLGTRSVAANVLTVQCVSEMKWDFTLYIQFDKNKIYRTLYNVSSNL